MAAMTSNWAQLRQQVRQLESQTENSLHTFAQFSSLTDVPPKPTDDEQRAEAQVHDLLSQRENVVQQLTRLLESDPQPSALKSSHLARHRETLTQHRTELRRLQGQLATARDRSNLLSSVRSDIRTYRARDAERHAADPSAAEADYMLEERGHIDNSHRVADGVLAQAYAVNEAFGLQREQLERVRARVRGVVGMVPGINTLIGKIGTKKRRDGIIMGGFIAFCFLMLLWFM